ncbi:MAG: Rqc2 family fibronectin-binding protein [Rhodothermales bacterium]
MTTNFYTLQALVREWTSGLVGCAVGDAFSQTRDEWTLALGDDEKEWMLRLSLQAPRYLLFRSEGYSRARRNVATLFEDAFGRHVTDVRLAERDRMLFLDLEGGFVFQIVLFGPRPNVLLVDGEGIIVEAFQRDADLAGQAAPHPRPAPDVRSFGDFKARWQPKSKSLDQAVARALPLFDRTLGTEVVYRADVQQVKPEACSDEELAALFESAMALRDELTHPQPRIYWRDRFAEVFSLAELTHLTDVREAGAALREERFETVDSAVRVFARRWLGQRRFRSVYDPLERALEQAAGHFRQSADRMLEELTKESRADRYEQWGHLLMAAPDRVPAGAETAALPDLFNEGTTATIPLDPALGAIENAQRYYDRARRTRQARLHAEDRLLATESRAEEAGRLLDEIRQIENYTALERFKKDERSRLLPFLSEQSDDTERLPFRRFELEGGYEVWVGKNAKQNDALTFRYAQKHDLWMHARGTPGSHTVLRLPGRHSQPGPRVLERAASIAAYYSKAQGSALVPVMVTERKYVRKAKGAPPGAVIVEREEVLLVEPKLPGG